MLKSTFDLAIYRQGAGLLALEFGVALVVTDQAPSVVPGALRLIYLIMVGVTIGIAVAWIVYWLERHIDDGQSTWRSAW